MVYTLSCSNIHESEYPSVGKRASFLSKVANKGVNTCLFFVVTNNALDRFFEHNSLKDKINSLLEKRNETFWDDFKMLFSDCSFPDDVKKEIRDSYDALSISSSDVSNILRSFESRVNLLISSQEDTFLSGVFLNIKGFDNLLNAIKSSWFSHIRRNGIDFLKNDILNFSVGVLVEKFVSSDFCVEVEFSSDKKSLLLHVYKGLPEVSGDIVKDFYVLSFNHLEFVSYELNSQNFSILHQEDSGVLLKKRLGKEGADNKASKQLVSECARFAKRIFDVLDDYVKIVFLVKKEIPYLFLVDKETEEVGDECSSVVKEKEEVVIGEGSREFFGSEKVPLSSSDLEEVVSDDVSSEPSYEFDEEKEEVLEDSDEFIVQNEGSVISSGGEVFSSFFKLAELLEEDLTRSYKESFGFEPNGLEEAVYELDSKHGFSARDKILRVLEVKSLIMQGEEVDEDIISSLIGVMEDFLNKEENK